MRLIYFSLFSLLFCACSRQDELDKKDFSCHTITADGKSVSNPGQISVNPSIRVAFTTAVDTSSAREAVQFFSAGALVQVLVTFENYDSIMLVRPRQPLPFLTSHDLLINNALKDKKGNNLLSACQYRFTTPLDFSDKFPRITDDSLLTLVQRQTFRYFWDFAHPVSGMIRERNTSGDLVTSGGTGFGIMALLVGIERGFITREQGRNRILKITDFLLRKADKFHGAFPHWLDGSTGKVIPFSTRDDGGDLVETSYLMAGLLCAFEYFSTQDPNEILLQAQIDTLWREVEWDWYTQGKDVLYWHWSPRYEWAMNHRIEGWNEALITYILAASSPTHPIKSSVYDSGWARNGAMRNGRMFYGKTLPLGYDYGGPLFFAHYSFLGIDPRKLSDKYGSYSEQVVAHSLINYQYCVDNPRNFIGYSPDCWGLTASDNPWGYDAHSPTNDKGVISPTAALSSMPFTPVESMKALHTFYYILGDKLFRQYGFVDAFSLQYFWFADSFLAIDQGPILIMIENYRTGKIWELTMQHHDIQNGLETLGFTYK